MTGSGRRRWRCRWSKRAEGAERPGYEIGQRNQHELLISLGSPSAAYRTELIHENFAANLL